MVIHDNYLVGVASFNWWVWPVPDLYFQKLEPMLMKYLLTPDCSRAGAVPTTQRTSPTQPSFQLQTPPTIVNIIYYHMTTPPTIVNIIYYHMYRPKSGSPRFRAKCARPLSFVKAGSGNATTLRLLLLAGT